MATMQTIVAFVGLLVLADVDGIGTKDTMVRRQKEEMEIDAFAHTYDLVKDKNDSQMGHILLEQTEVESVTWRQRVSADISAGDTSSIDAGEKVLSKPAEDKGERQHPHLSALISAVGHLLSQSRQSSASADEDASKARPEPANMSQEAAQPMAEDDGYRRISMAVVSMPSTAWTAISVAMVLLLCGFLAYRRNSTNSPEQGEDVSVYQVLPIALLWSLLGCTLVIFNKFLFLGPGFGFDFPYAIFLMWAHSLVGTIAMNVILLLWPALLPAVVDRRLTPQKYLVAVLPVAALQAFALSLGNLAYLHISVTYIQMVKNTTSAFVYVFSIVLGHESATYCHTIAVALVVLGLVLTSVGELELTLLGFALQLGSTLCDAFRLSLMKLVLSSKHAVNLDPMSALYFFAPTMCAVLTVPMLYFDYPHMTLTRLLSLSAVLLTNALIAFSLNMTSIFFMQRCGATTYALTGVVKDIALILFAVALFGYVLTMLQMIGFVVSLAGFHLYNTLKQDQVKQGGC